MCHLAWKDAFACFFGREKDLKYPKTAFTDTKKKELHIKESDEKKSRFQVWSLWLNRGLWWKKPETHSVLFTATVQVLSYILFEFQSLW